MNDAHGPQAPAAAPLQRRVRVVLRCAGIVAVYCAVSVISHAVRIGADQVTMVWLPAGVALATLLLFGRRYWPVVLLADLAMQMLPPPTPLPFIPVSALANTLSALAAATVVERLHRDDLQSYSVRTGTATVIAAFVSAGVSAPIGVLGLVLTIGLPFSEVGHALVKWLSANVFGVLLVTPALILGALATREPSGRALLRFAGGREIALWLLLYAASAALLFLQPIAGAYMLGLFGVPLALLTWASLRFEPLAAAIASLVSGIAMVLICGLGIGGFAVPPTHADSVVLMLFLATIALMPLFLSAASHERRLATVRLRLANESLERRVAERTAELSSLNDTLTGAMHELRETQNSLVEREKMASLGGLVAGIAHEINTPVGVALTTASTLADHGSELARTVDAGKLSKRQLDTFLATLAEGTQLLVHNLQRTSDLVTSFKQLAVDQTSEQRRRIHLHDFLSEVLLALRPVYKRSCSVECACPHGLVLETYPGALSQVLANLLSNSVTHAFADRTDGRVTITANAGPDDGITLTYGDDGAGMPKDVAERAFEPFFTTRRGSGGSGLGLHLVYNLVAQVLGGRRIELTTAPGAGCTFRIWLPREAPVAVASVSWAAAANALGRPPAT